MKKLLSILAVLFLLGSVPTAANAALSLDFNIDFHTDGLSNPTTVIPSGDYNTGETIDLFVGESVWVDFYADVLDTPLSGAGYSVSFSPSGALSVTDYSVPSSPWFDLGSSTSMINVGIFSPFATGTDNYIGSFLLECIAPGADDVLLSGTFVGPNVDDLVVTDFSVGTINNVPIPGAFLLLGSGLVGLIGLRRKRG